MAAAPAFAVLGRPIPRVEGLDKVTGRAHYTADVVPANTLWAKNVLSPLPHARIVAIDTARALRVPGVRAVLTAADVPFRRIGRRLKDYPILARERVLYVGERVAVVAAESRDAAEEAALLVDVEYEELPAVFDALEAMEADAPILHPDLRSYVGFPEYVPADLRNVHARVTIDRGNVDEAFARADLVLEHTFRTGTMHQGFIEPHATVVAIDDGGRVEIWQANKANFRNKEEMAGIIDLPPEQIVYHAVSVGGDFGGKGAPGDAPAGYHLARITGRPIKFINTNQEELSAGSPRHPSVTRIKSGVMRDGTVIARDVFIVYNSGAYGGLRPNVMDGMLPGAGQAGNQYAPPNLRVDGRMVYTNEIPRTYMRSPGQPQAVFALEAHMDLLARAVGMDPLEFRAKNLGPSPDGGEPVATTLLRSAAQAVGWGAPKAAFVGRGVAMASRNMGGGPGSSDVTLHPDGTVTAITSAPDVGTGTMTVVAAVVAESLGLPVERVAVVHGDTDTFPNDTEAGASRMTNSAGHAAIAACDQLKEQLTPLAAAMLGASAATWDNGGWRSPDGRWVSIEDLAGEMIKPGDPVANVHLTVTVPGGKEPERSAQAAEVEVDPETGQVTVRRLASAQAVGTIINETAHQGQIDGCVVQGFGYALTEELVLQDGRVATAHFGDYKLPTIADVPPLTTINVQSHGEGPFGAQAIGETPVVPTPAAIANAVADAIGVPVTELPLSAERVLDLIARKTGR
ncbi:MAG TPA: xanthine dehydrogenase family protein molybdopterin-binding subunit [Chloroflexota bacterium]|nr:xanthine dehydrogenase family protein molybdopterin-binding subunit [Chloroflexota bacterium]